jgi:dUTP pyrophosphatase
VGAHCIDSGYDGEVFIDLHNIGKSPQVIRPRDKVAQLVLVPVVSFRAQEVGDDNLYQEPITISARGDGALGSTGK